MKRLVPIGEFSQSALEVCFQWGLRNFHTDQEAALNSFKEGLKLDPLHKGCNYNAGILLYYHFHKPEEAIKYLEKVTGEPVAYRAIAQWYDHKDGDHEKALHYYKEAAYRGDLESTWWLAKHYRMCDLEKAAQYAEKILPDHRYYKKARLIIADWYQEGGFEKTAQDIWVTLGDHPEALYKLGLSRIKSNPDPNKGLADIKSSAEMGYQDAILYIADHMYCREEFSEALEWYEKMENPDPSILDIIQSCKEKLPGKILADAHELIEAENYIKAEKLLEELGDHPEALYQLGMLHIKHGLDSGRGIQKLVDAGNLGHPEAVLYLIKHFHRTRCTQERSIWYKKLHELGLKEVSEKEEDEEYDVDQTEKDSAKGRFEFYRVCDKIRKMAEKGDMDAQIFMGLIYSKAGEREKASEWFDQGCGYTLVGTKE